MNYEAIMDKARKTNRERDTIERESGSAPPSRCPIDVQIRTVMGAIECGIRSEDWNAVAEAQGMLEDLLETVPVTS